MESKAGEKRLDEWTEQELEAELGKRRGERLRGRILAVEEQLWEEDHDKKRAALEQYLQREANFDNGKKQACPRCGKPAALRAKDRERVVESLMGTVRFRRNYHYCQQCGLGFYPTDQRLGLPEDGELTAALERRILDFGVNDSFAQAAERWSVHYSRPISETLVKRVVARQGKVLAGKDPMVVQQKLCPAPAQVADQLIVQMDGSMVSTRGKDPWKEVKLGAIVRGDQYLSCHNAKRGQITQARYVARLGTVAEFKPLLEAALTLERADQVPHLFVVADGAPWIWNLASELCPSAIQVLDWPHAAQAIAKAAAALFDDAPSLQQLFYARATSLVFEGHIHAFFQQLRECKALAKGSQLAALVDLERYLSTNRSRLLYKELRDKGFIIGSGIVESANKHVVQQRMKRAGQHWNVVAADRMAALRAAYRSSSPKKFFAALDLAA